MRAGCGWGAEWDCEEVGGGEEEEGDGEDGGEGGGLGEGAFLVVGLWVVVWWVGGGFVCVGMVVSRRGGLIWFF